MFAKSFLKTTTFAGALALVAGFATLALPGFAGTAQAATQPDYARYCRTAHPGSFVNRLRTTGERICTKRSHGGWGLTHHRINLARACRLTTGNTRFRNYGNGHVLCQNRTVTRNSPPKWTRGTQPRPRATRIPPATSRATTQPNYARYCRRAHPGSFANRLRTTGEHICTQRSHGGWGLTHHRINLARACRLTTGNTRYRNFGNGYVLCQSRQVTRATPPKWNRGTQRRPRATRTMQRTPNLRAYCSRIHPGSSLNTLRTTGEFICTQRSHGGWGLTHHRINMAQACMISWRTTSFRYLLGNRRQPRCLVRTA